MLSAIYPVVCFGEVLWDLLSNETLPGGAPMNVAYHLQKLGTPPALITRIGMDDYGKRLISHLSSQDLTTDYFQVDDDYHSTGLVYAIPNEYHEVVYDIVYPSAWDFIQWNDEYFDLVSKAEYFVFGSLTSRSKASRDTLSQLLEGANKKVLNLNLRSPHYHRLHVEALLQQADLLRLNIGELQLVTGWFSHFRSVQDRMKILQDQFSIETIMVTMGDEGVMVNDNGILHRLPGYKVEIADPIGSGDAFLAGFLHQKLQGSPTPEALQFASGLGAFIATRSGACPSYESCEITAFMSSATPLSV